MPKLILSMDGLVLKEIALDKERISIGRKPSNDIQIDNLAISGHHALITTILNDAFLEDQNSTNGTYVNGQPVKKCVLRHNDIVELGKYRLKFLVEAVRKAGPVTEYAHAAGDVETAPASPVPGNEVSAPRSVTANVHAAAPVAVPTTAARRAAEATSIAAVRDPAPDATQVLSPDLMADACSETGFDDSRVGVINVLSGPNAGRQLVLAKALTTLGKPGKQVAVITRRLQGYFITHVEGATFPAVNGHSLDARSHPLNDGDVIEIAGVKMAFSLSA